MKTKDVKITVFCKATENEQLFSTLCNFMDAYLSKSEDELQKIIDTWYNSETFRKGEIPKQLAFAQVALIVKKFHELDTLFFDLKYNNEETNNNKP